MGSEHTMMTMGESTHLGEAALMGDEGTADAELVEAITARNQEALREAYDRYSSRVMGVALGILKSKELAEDVTQEVFVRLWNRPDRFDAGRGTLRAFLQIDARGRSIDLMRSMRAASQRDQIDYRKQSSTVTPGTEELAMTAVTSESVRDAIDLLPEEQRVPIALAFFDGFSYRDVADQLGLPEGTVKSRIRAGMRRLRLALAPEVG